MKSLLLPTLCIVLMSSFISASTTTSLNDFTIKVNGLENRNVMTEGISASEFATMTIQTNDENRQIKGFEISLARGNQLVSLPGKTVIGNSFDLKTYSALARPGDRIVIKLNTAIDKKDHEGTSKHFYMTIPVK